MDKHKTENVRWKKDGFLGILTLENLPENYLINPEFVTVPQLEDWLSDDIRAMIITGSGRHFSAGADLKEILRISRDSEELKSRMTNGNHLLNFISRLEIPTLAAINGICFGGGLEIALACDIRFCTQRSLFAFPEINYNLIPGLGGLNRVERICGHQQSMEILFSGDTLNANKALELNIVDRIIDQADLIAFCKKYLEGLIKERSPEVIRMLMRSFRNAEFLTAEEAMKKDVEIFCSLAGNFSAID